MRFKKKLITILIFGTSFTACNYFEKEKEDNTLRNLGILSIIGRTNTTTTSSCSGSSGAVICIPQGIAE